MNILFVGDFAFPFGDAAASRIRHCAQGLSELGHNVRVLSQRRLRRRAEDVVAEGVAEYRCIRYEGCNRAVPVERSGVRGILDRCQSLIQSLTDVSATARRAREIAVTDHVDVIIQYTLSYYALRSISDFCRSLGIVLIRDVVEWPAINYFKEGILHPRFIDYQLGVRRAVQDSDGVIGVSEFLASFYARRGIPTVCIPANIAIPETVPPRPNRSQANEEFHITYLGNLSARNGPYEMLAGIRLALARGLSVRFNIVGSSGRDGEDRRVRQWCERDTLLCPKVTFLGRLSDEAVTCALMSADALLFARPDDTVAKAAFPTRLPEYMVSGRPVITAAVGDIPRYLRHGTDALLFPPRQPEMIADHIAYLVNLPDHGEAIGRSGFERARQHFNYRTRARELDELLRNLFRTKRKGVRYDDTAESSSDGHILQSGS